MSENIKKLSEKEKVRKKISVWLGASNHIAVLHTVKEILGNSVDEINKGKGNEIQIIKHDDKTLTIMDNCKGLPLEGKNSDGIDNYKLLFETLFAGTKYDNGIENNNYTVGVNGLFNTVLTFASEDVIFEVARPDKNIYSVSYHKGDNVKPLEVIGKTDETYTKITYTLDDDIFEDNYFTFEELCDIASEQASLIDGKIVVHDEKDNTTEEFEYKEGITEFLNNKTEQLQDITDMIYFEDELSHTIKQSGEELIDNMKVSIAMKYSKDDEGNVGIEFLNGSNLLHHGTIYEGFITGLRNIVNKFLKDNNMYTKNEKQVSKDDVIVGLNYVIDFKSYFPVFANQTKFASYVKYYEQTMKDVLDDFFEYFIVENKKEMELIAEQILVNKRSREKAENTRQNVKKKLQGNVNNLTNRIEGYYGAKSKDKSKNALTICEGKSALSAMLSGRQEHHAIFPIRGKILNCLKAPTDKALENDVIQSLIKVLGCGVEIGKDKKYFDMNKLNFSKVVVYVDADHDGMGSILPLLLTVFWKLTPTLVKEGYIYLCETPKYEIIMNDENYYAVDDIELDKFREKNKNKKYDLHYIKGLAELSSEAMEMCLSDNYKNTTQITLDNIEESINVLEMYMGTEITKRKNVILGSFE